MNMCLFYNPPETAVEPLNYFFSRLDEFMALKAEIFRCEELYQTKIPGCAAGGLYVGCYPLSVGDLLCLYETDKWRMKNKNGELCYFYRVTGSPLSGMNTCQIWNQDQKKFMTTSVDSFGRLAFPAVRLERKTFGETKVSRRAAELFAPLNEKIERFYFEKALEEKRRAFFEKVHEEIKEQTDKNGVTSLMRFCESGALKKVIRIWLKEPQRFNAAARDGRTVINFAAKDLACLKFILKKGKTAYRFSPLADVCETSPDIEERLDLLMRAGVDIDATNPDKETPLIVAAQTMNVRALKCLLAAGADKTVKNAEGKTAHDIAVENGVVFDFGRLTEELKPY